MSTHATAETNDQPPMAGATARAECNGVTYIPVPSSVRVVFATQDGVLDTLERPVAYRQGDAIVTGAVGERWPIARDAFERRYHPSDGQPVGEPGLYAKRPLPVTAERLRKTIDIPLPDGRGTLHGEAGDWVVDEGRQRWIVRHDIFPQTYALRSIPVYLALDARLTTAQVAEAQLAAARLRQCLGDTPIVLSGPGVDLAEGGPVWFTVTPDRSTKRGSETSLELPLTAFAGPRDARGSLLHTLDEARSRSVWRYTVAQARRFGAALRRGSTDADEARVSVVAAQLDAVDHVNQHLRRSRCAASDFQRDCAAVADELRQAAPLVEPAGLARILHMGAVANQLATDDQTAWQRTMLATTKEIASLRPLPPRRRAVRLLRFLGRGCLFTWGLLAASGFATFSELSAGCTADSVLAISGCASETWRHDFEPVDFLLVYCGSLVAGWLVYARAKVRKVESRHQDLRLFAECLRARYLSVLLQHTACVSEHLPLSPATDAGWVRAALRSIHFAQPVGALDPRDEEVAALRVRQDFVATQIDYHRTLLLARRRDAKKVLDAFARWGVAGFLGALGLMVIHQGSELIFAWPLLGTAVPHLLTIVLIVTLVFYGSMRKVVDVLGLELEIQRGEFMLEALEAVHAEATDGAGLHAALRRFVEDQAGWHTLHRNKPLEAATGT